VRSLRGSTSRSTEPPATEDLTRLSPDPLPAGGGKGTEGLSTVVEEDFEDWVDDFDDISLEEVPLGVEGVDRAAAGSSSRTQTQLTHESDSAFASRPRTTSKTSRRSRKSSELRLILDFPLPPTFIPTPNSKTPLSIPVRLPHTQQDTPVRDDESISEDRDTPEVAEADITRVGSSASFYTANSQSPSPVPSVQSVHTDPAPPPSPLPSAHPPPLSPLHLPFPDQPSLSPQPSRTAETPSTTHTHRSIRTLTKASETLKRFGNLTRETLRTSFRTPVSELSVRKARRGTARVAHVSLDQLQHSSLPNVDRSPLLPDFHPEAFDVSFPAVETPHGTPRTSRLSRAHPSVHSFYASLEEFLTSHLRSDDSNNRRSRFISAPTLLVTAERDTPKPTTSPPAVTDTQVVILAPAPLLPCPDRPLPPLPREGYDFVDPSTLTESATVSPASEHRYSSIPPSPSWLSRNVRDLEIALIKKAEAPSLSSSRSAFGSDTDNNSSDHRRKATHRTHSSSTVSSPLRLHGEVVFLRGRVNIQDSKPRHITLKSSSRTPSDATVIQTRTRPRRSRSNHPRLPPSPVARPRSRTSSVTKATITHYRRSLVETRKKSRAHKQKEAPTQLSPRAQVPKASFISFFLSQVPFITRTADTLVHEFVSIGDNEQAYRLSSSPSRDCASL
jgi:hypothetical protein